MFYGNHTLSRFQQELPGRGMTGFVIRNSRWNTSAPGAPGRVADHLVHVHLHVAFSKTTDFGAMCNRKGCCNPVAPGALLATRTTCDTFPSAAATWKRRCRTRGGSGSGPGSFRQEKSVLIYYSIPSN